uniref:RHS repeat-associated core domain-containing protein n=1 Tax=Treponema sp. TaxID=166 RepID=UPI00388DDEC4
RIEYTPYGETWVDVKVQGNKELVPLSYRFSAKELDKETGFYYYGARYLDPKYSRWISADPAMNTGEYFPVAPNSNESKQHNSNLPGLGGIYNHINLNLYHYANNNPIRYADPDGRKPSPWEAAQMADDVYKEVSGEISGGWVREDLKILNKNNGTGAMGIYSRINPETNEKEYALVNRGTKPTNIEDWKQNRDQVFGKSTDLKKSVQEAKKFKANHPGSEITMVGHSKGGAEAFANAIATGTDAILFNPATLNPIANGFGLGKHDGNITAYIVYGEILNNIFGDIPQPYDNVHYLFPRVPLSGVVPGIINHSMDSVKLFLNPNPGPSPEFDQMMHDAHVY